MLTAGDSCVREWPTSLVEIWQQEMWGEWEERWTVSANRRSQDIHSLEVICQLEVVTLCGVDLATGNRR